MTTIDCREAVHRMWAYLSQALERADAEELEGHLAVCQRCCGELEFSRELRDRVSAVETQRMPPEVASKVEAVLRQGTIDPGGTG